MSQGTPPSIGAISFGKPEIDDRGATDAKVMIIPNGTVSPSYFTTLGIPLVTGRNFTTDDPQGTVIVSKAFADDTSNDKLFWRYQPIPLALVK